MSWVCPVCSNNNTDTDESCLLCGTARPAPAKEDAVCTLTARRAAEMAGGDLFIPSEFNVIGEEAFKGRTDITAVYIHSGVRNIKRSAFEGCTMLSKVQSDGKLNSIGARAFAGCTYLCPERRASASRVAADAYEGCSATYCDPPPRPAITSRPASTKSRDTSLRSSGGSGSSRSSSEIDTSLRRPTFGMGTSGSSSVSKSTSTSTSTSSGATRTSTSSSSSSATRTSTSSGGMASTRTSTSTSTSTRTSTPSGGSSYGGTRPTSYSTPTRTAPKPPSRFAKMFSWWTDRYTSSVPTVSRGNTYHTVDYYGMYILAGLIVFGLALGVLMNFGRVMDASAWQGAFSVPLALGTVLFTYLFLVDCDYDRLPMLYAGVVGVNSFVMLIFAERAIEFISVVALATAFSGICATLAVFNNGDDKNGFQVLGLSALSLATLIYLIADGWYLIDAEHWQLLVSLLIGMVFVLVMERMAGNDYLEYEYTVAVHIIPLVICVILALVLRDRLAVVTTVLPLMMCATSSVLSGVCIREYEGFIGGVHIFLAVLDAALAVCVQLFYA